MARSVDEINSYIVDQWVANAKLIGVTVDQTLWSKRSMLRFFIYSVAIGIAVLEQLMDVFIAAVESQVAVSAAASPLWVQNKMFKFQYSDTVPQFVSLIDDAPQYAIVDETLQIIKACSVTTSVSSAVTIKAAKLVNNLLTAMTTNELMAAQGYINTIGTAGIGYSVQSNNPDQLFIDIDLYFQGQYSSTILATVITTITNWLATQAAVNFNGKIKMSDLEQTIRDIPGVNDVVLKNVRGRKDSDTFEAGIDLIVNETLVFRQYSSDAGYLIPETTAGKTLDTSINLISE